jgi:phosphatidylserine/phosphatidylglycerophosphate/cardiolipin synthase-like enzyme
VGVYFSPGRGADEIVVGFIDRCEKTLDVAIYSLTHDPIRDALIRAHKRGVKVRVLMDNLQARSRYADDEVMAAAGIPVRVDLSSAAMHDKFAIGDSKAVLTGSFNWTKNAVERNAENFVIVRMRYIIRPFEQEFERLWEDNVLGEVMRPA